MNNLKNILGEILEILEIMCNYDVYIKERINKIYYEIDLLEIEKE